MEINGLPAHVLVIHAAVVFVPLAALVSLAYAWLSSWRWAVRWPMIALAVTALGAVVAAYFSGKDLQERFERADLELPPAVQLHEERAEVLLWLTVVFVVIVLLAAWGLGGPSALKSDRGARGRHDPLIEWSLVTGLTFFAIATMLMTIQTGDAGADAVWGQLPLD